MHQKTGILKNITLKHSPIETIKMLQKLWGLSLMDAKLFLDYILLYKEIDLQKGFYFLVNGTANYRENIHPDVFSDIFNGDFIEATKGENYGDFFKGIVISNKVFYL